MIKHARLLTLVAAAALTLAACSSNSSKAPATDAQSSNAGTAAAAPESSTSSSTTSGSSGSGTQAGDVDVCALLTPADAISVAMADKLDAAQTSSTTYKLTAKKSDSGAENTSSCDFTIDDSNASNNFTGAEGTITFLVGPGSAIAYYKDGKKVPGLGDEAYTNDSGGTVVRVGNLLITEGQDSCGPQITLDLLRKIAPVLKSKS